MKLTRLAGRAAAVWRREGLGGSRGGCVALDCWRPEGVLQACLETPLLTGLSALATGSW
jgi:hypothetical protein